MPDRTSSDDDTARRHGETRRYLSDGGTADGLVTLESDASVAESVERVRETIEEKDGLSLMTTVDHAENAESTDHDLPPTTVLVFGNPELGTPAMQSGRSLGIDLPQKLLVTERDDGTVTVSYNDPAYLAERHGIDDDEWVDDVGDALSSLAAVAAGRD